jgi:DNA-binding beta-propeller fold protein YncE
MKLSSKLVLAASTLAAAGLLVSQPGAPETVGPRPGGAFLLNSGWLLKPAGRQVPLSTGPQATALSPDGKYLAILQAGYLPPSVSIHDPETLAEISRIHLPDAWLGLAFAPKGNLLYVGGGSRSTVYELAITPQSKLELRRQFTVVAEKERKHTDFIGDVTLSPDGRLIYAAALYRNSIIVINPQSGMIIEEWKTALRPFRILFHPSGKSFYVTGWGDASLRQIDANNGQEIARYNAGPQPMDMVWRDKPATVEAGEEPAPFGPRLFVASSGTNLVQVFAASENGELRRLESINVSFLRDFYQPAGMTPSALALSPDQDALWVVCADANAVAKVDVSGKRSVVKGFIPVGWYPLAARVLPDKTLLVLNGRGARSFPNRQGPNPSRKQAVLHEGNVAVEYVGAIQRGSASLIPDPSPEDLDAYTAQVAANSPHRGYAIPAPAIPAGHILSRADGHTPPIEHVIYVIKENRTYDQVLGDLGIGNGDPTLTLFGEQSSPNHHKLAREFVLLDNFYVSADVSADGHNWSTSAIAPAYVQRMWPNSYAGRRKHYDYEGGERAALPPAGYIWTSAIQAGLSYRNYGWWCSNITPAPPSGRQIAAVRDPALAPYTNLNYRGFDLDYKDTARVRVFLQDLAEFERSGRMPQFITLRLGNDHTSGAAAGKISPLAAMADNDAALGLLVEAVSRSRFWPSTAIFVLEDDAQNGPDHVDSHRSPAFIISPFTRGRGIDSTFYNTVSALHTMEHILGLNPMTMHDAAARTMYSAFLNRPDPRPFTAEKPRLNPDERNPAGTALAARSASFDFEEADRIDDDQMNEILWRAIRKSEPPVPTRSFWGR